MRTNTQAAFSAYIASIGKRTPRVADSSGRVADGRIARGLQAAIHTAARPWGQRA
jgi:hypothetical protein